MSFVFTANFLLKDYHHYRQRGKDAKQQRAAQQQGVEKSLTLC